MAQKIAIEDTFEAPVEERLRTYETTIVLSSKAGEEAREALLGQIRNFIADRGGEIIEVSPAKEYALAYPIEKEQQGIMRTLVYKSSTDVPNALAEELRHETTVLRMLSIDQPKRSEPRRSVAPFSPMPTLTADAPTGESAPPQETAAKDAAALEEQIEGAISNL